MAMDHHSQVLQGRVKREMVAALKNADQQGDWTRRDPDGRMEGLGEDDEFVVDLFVQDGSTGTDERRESVKAPIFKEKGAV